MPLKLISKLFSPPYVSLSDEELMKLVQADNHSAFTELYSRYKTPLFSYFSGLLNSTLAEELFQETFIKILNNRMNFRFESKLKTWIWTIARNTIRDYWRSLDHKMKNSFDSLVSEEGEEVFEAQLDSTEQIILNKVTKNQLEDCINEFSADQKEIILLHIQSELTNQEIANLSHLKIGAIKSILFRSKEKLIDCFRRGGHL